MPSHLRLQTNADSFDASFDSHPSSPLAPPHKKQKMSVTQTYRLAHTARGKLSAEASRGEYDLRVLVGHANLLDNLMIELADAEREQEEFYHSNIRSSPLYTVAEDEFEIPDGSDSEEEDDFEDLRSDYSDYEDEQHFARMAAPPQRSSSRPSPVAVAEDFTADAEDEDYDDDYNNPELSLVRTPSHIADESLASEQGVPELVHSDDDDSDDDSLSSPPISPGQPPISFGSINIKDFAMKTQAPVAAAEALSEDGFWIPNQQPIAAF